MQKILLLLSTQFILQNVQAGSYSNCEIEGVGYWNLIHRLDKIEDVHEGVITTFRTENILEMRSYTCEGDYLTATFEKDIITISTTERFKQFDEERKSSLKNGYLKMTFDFLCSDQYDEDLEMQIEVIDTNNHAPVLNKENYEYHFGFTIPKNFELTQLVQIEGVDADFSNYYLYFEIEKNDYFTILNRGKSNDYGKTVYTTLTTLQEIKAPFFQELTMKVTDEGKPEAQSTSAKLIISVSDDLKTQIEDAKIPKPAPVFAQHTYLAKYTSGNKLELENPIVIKEGNTPTTKLGQIGYLEYFKVSPGDLTKGEVKIELVKPLPENSFKNEKVIVVEIQAENEKVSIPGRTILVISVEPRKSNENNPETAEAMLRRDDSEEDSEEDDGDEGRSSNCKVTYISGFKYSESALPVIVCLCGVFLIILTNVIVLAVYFTRRKVVDEIAHDVHVNVHRNFNENVPKDVHYKL